MSKGKASALVVDDEVYIQEILCSTLRDAGFECIAASDGDTALQELRNRRLELVFADMRMPGKSGLELLQLIKSEFPDVIVIMVTAVDDAATAVETIRAGAYDYIIKPFNLDQVLVAADRALDKRRLEDSKREYQRHLKLTAEERAVETRRLFYLMTQVLVRLLELRMPFHVGHSVRVADMSRFVARELKMTEDGIRKVYLAALLHDIGMIAAEDVLLTKPGALSLPEEQKLRGYSQLTEAVLKPILEDGEVLGYIRHIRERYDGSGYPDGLKGNLIPLGSRVISVVEAFDAMTQDRPYRRARNPENALAELTRCADSQFDCKVVNVFAELYERVFRNEALNSSR